MRRVCALSAETVFNRCNSLRSLCAAPPYERHTCCGAMGVQALVGRQCSVSGIAPHGIMVHGGECFRHLFDDMNVCVLRTEILRPAQLRFAPLFRLRRALRSTHVSWGAALVGRQWVQRRAFSAFRMTYVLHDDGRGRLVGRKSHRRLPTHGVQAIRARS